MKKQLSVLSLAVAPAFAMAAGTAITSTTNLTAAACALLQDDVRIQMSTNVVGAHSCDTVNSPQAIHLAMCHTAGRTSTRTANTVVDPAQCTLSTTNTAACVPTTTSASGAVIPQASTLGGSMVMNFNGTTCNTTGANAAAVLP